MSDRDAACGITFLYVEDLAAAARFYAEVMGFALVMDQGFARIYRIAGHSHVGLVDGTRGHLRPQPSSAVLLTIVVEDVAAWHARLAAAGVRGLTPIRRTAVVEGFFFEDPAGYALEVQRFRDPAVAAMFRTEVPQPAQGGHGEGPSRHLSQDKPPGDGRG